MAVPSPDAPDGQAQYRERLTPPWWGWLLAAFWASTLGIAYGYAVSALVGVIVGLAMLVLASVAIARWSAVVEVGAERLRAGRATLPASAIGAATPMTAAAARAKRGTDADPRAFVLLRGWITTAVTVEVRDDNDPTPYWYVSTRRPDELAAALAAIAQHVTPTISAESPAVKGSTDEPGFTQAQTSTGEGRHG